MRFINFAAALGISACPARVPRPAVTLSLNNNHNKVRRESRNPKSRALTTQHAGSHTTVHAESLTKHPGARTPLASIFYDVLSSKEQLLLTIHVVGGGRAKL